MHPGTGQPRRRALARGDRRARIADHRPGRERAGGPDGDPLRAAGRRRRPRGARAPVTPSCRRRPRSASRPDARRSRPRLARERGRACRRPDRSRGPGARSARANRRAPRRRRPRRRDRRARRGRARAGRRRRGDRGARDWPLFPAFFDPHVHLRTPGREDEEDVETGSRAAAAGGYCGILAMANTEPPVDTAADVAALREQAREQAAVPTGFVACVTRGMAGEELTEMAELADAGAVGFSDDGLPIAQRPGAAARAPVPAPGRAADRAARGGSGALGRRLDARGRRLRGARDRRRALDLRVDDDRPRLRARGLRGRRGSTSSTCRPPSRWPRSSRRRPAGSRSPARRPRIT